MRFLNFEKMQWVWWCLYYENLSRRRTSCTKISMQRLPLSNRFESQPIRKRFCQKRQSQLKWQNFAARWKPKKKYLEVSKLDYVIILVIITVRCAIGMTFDQFQDLLFKIGIFLRNESAEVRDLKSTGSVHGPSTNRPRKVDPWKVHFVSWMLYIRKC